MDEKICMKESPLCFLASKAKLAICIIAACLDLPVYMVLLPNGTVKAFAAFSISISININESKARNLHHCILSRPARLHGAHLKAFAALGPFCPPVVQYQGILLSTFTEHPSQTSFISEKLHNTMGSWTPSVP